MVIMEQETASTNGSTLVATRESAFIIFESCIFVLLNIMAFTGNLLVCIAFYKNPSLRSITNYFVLSLALTDLAMAVFVIPLATASSIANKWVAGDLGCKLRYFFTNSLGGTSLLTVMLLALNRYFRVVRPSLYPKLFSSNGSVTMALSAWIVTIIAVIILFFATGVQFETLSVQPAFCLRTFTDSAGKISFGVVHDAYIAIPSLVIVFCYVRIYQSVRKHNAVALSSPRKGKCAYGIQEKKMTRMLTVVVAGFYLCWLPLFVTQILMTFTKIIKERDIKFYNFYFNFPGYCSSVINPVVYATMNPPFRSEFRNIFRCSKTETAWL